MDIYLLFKIAGVGVIIVVLEQLFKSLGKNDQATMVTLAGLVIVLMMVLSLIAKLFDNVKTLFQF